MTNDSELPHWPIDCTCMPMRRSPVARFVSRLAKVEPELSVKTSFSHSLGLMPFHDTGGREP